MKEYVQTGDCNLTFPEVPTPANYVDSDGTTQKLSRMKSVIDAFAIRVFESKKEAYTKILQEVSGLCSSSTHYWRSAVMASASQYAALIRYSAHHEGWSKYTVQIVYPQ